ncbi:histidine--tRNA ligase [Candidatus Roizmanbacteria bacterium CG02_land_8_20_14_3_00_36_15]|nr:MAG: histidine--tRNA ligase [Candidatus Roizmanbacteria bacterium CG02_land_8_20_14_3_00_36_15]
MNKRIQAQRLKGFRDFFADDIVIREYVINIFKSVFEKYGYEPLETPALEYSDVFLRESGEEAIKLFYRFKDEGGRDIMLKYEVMISMCRAVAENINKIIFPYKRYQIQTVWRAEKPQKGRFREFTQCDADTIDSSSVLADAEFIQMGIEVMEKLGFKKFIVNISNRKFLNGIIKFSGAKNEQFIPICLCIDKLPKIGLTEVKKELLGKRKIPLEVVEKILSIINTKGETEELMQKYKGLLKDIPVAMEGLNELEQIFKYLKLAKISKETYKFSPYIARGLAYYNGPVWEFEIIDGGIGSVAGCGRYDDVIGKFVGEKIPATGGSFGIERIVEIIKERKMVNLSSVPTKVLLTYFDGKTLDKLIDIGTLLRKNDISTMLYPEVTKLDKQLKYADKKGIPYVIIIGPEEAQKNIIKLKDMKTGEQKELNKQELLKFFNNK